MAVLWIDVAMASGLRGIFRSMGEIPCESPEPSPTTVAEWQQWATAQLGTVAVQEQWQPGRYGYALERRDEIGRTVALLSRGVSQLAPLHRT